MRKTKDDKTEKGWKPCKSNIHKKISLENEEHNKRKGNISLFGNYDNTG